MAKTDPDDQQMRHAIDVFVRGFSFTRSFTHPCTGQKMGPLWVVKDEPRKRHVDYRNEEWIAYDTPPAKVDSIARNYARSRFIICHILPMNVPDESMRSEYKKLNYRLGHTEPLMVHDLESIPKIESAARIVRVLDEELSDRLNKAAGQRQILPELLKKDSPMRQYVALDENEEPIGWVGSVSAADSTWCRSMYVEPKHRRKGIGSALLTHMLRDDRKNGAKASILLANHTGAKLYPNVGYRQIGMLYVYTPGKKMPSSPIVSEARSNSRQPSRD